MLTYKGKPQLDFEFIEFEELTLEPQETLQHIHFKEHDISCYVLSEKGDLDLAFTFAKAVSLLPLFIELAKEHERLGLIYNKQGVPQGRKPPLKDSLMLSHQILRLLQDML